MRYIFLARILVILCLSFTASSVIAATYTVVNTNDSGPGSLREAFATANSTSADDLIVFDISGCPNGVCTIALTSGQFTVSGSNSAGTLTISNPAGPQNLIVSGNHASRIFYVDSGAHLSVDGLTMERGTAEGGGGILNRGDLRITNAAIQDCVSINYWAGGGIANDGGNLVLELSEVRNNTATWGGGGIFSMDGPLSIRDSTIAGNVAYGGGGIDLSAYASYSWSATIVNSTLSGNVSRHPDGDLQAGGAVYLENSGVPVHFINVTITQNLANTGGAVFADGLIGGSMFYRNSIFSGNTGSQYPDIDTRYVSTHDLGNNLIGGSPFLGPLANNGGPTRTHALLYGSLAINAGNNCVLTKNGCGDGNPALPTDQRGLPRVGTIDIGAFESDAATTQNRTAFDFDGDGKTDIGITRPNGGVKEWWISRSSDTNVFATGFGAASDVPAPADFTGDGKTDIAVFRPSTGQWFVLKSEDFTFLAFPFGTNGDIPMPADYDGDGKADPAVFRPSAGTWFISRTSDNQTTLAQFGTAGDQPVVADYDGDGKADLAICRQNNGAQEWWIQRSSAGLFATVFGATSDKAVPGDYTGDGKADVAVFRGSTGQWFILRSEDFNYLTFLWGSNGDIPAPGDYDGDGKFDAAVFRPSSTTWFINRTGGQGPLITNFGASSDAPVAGAFVR